MKIAGMSDIHGCLRYQALMEKVDVLCITGDFSPLNLQRAVSSKDGKGTMKRWICKEFIPWLEDLDARYIVLVPGNHDFVTERPWFTEWFNTVLKQRELSNRIYYLCNSSCEIEGIRFWGCPCSDLPNWAWPSRSNPESYTPKEKVDVLLVHAAPKWGTIGETYTRFYGREDFGSPYLIQAIDKMSEEGKLPKLLLCGHIHGGDHSPFIYGNKEVGECLMMNVAIKDEDYLEFWQCPVVDMIQSLESKETFMSVRQYINGHLKDVSSYVIKNQKS